MAMLLWDKTKLANFVEKQTTRGKKKTMEPNMKKTISQRWAALVLDTILALPLGAYPLSTALTCP